MSKRNWTMFCGFACALVVVFGTSLARPAPTPAVVPLATPRLAPLIDPVQRAWGHVLSYHGTYSGTVYGPGGIVQERVRATGLTITGYTPSVVNEPWDVEYQGHAHTTDNVNDGSCGTGTGSADTAVRLVVNIQKRTYYLSTGSVGFVTLHGAHTTPTNACKSPVGTSSFALTTKLPAPAQGICGTLTVPENYTWSWRLVPTTNDRETINVRCVTVPLPKNTGESEI
ncbi:MAG TPA: hypothetical protein VKF82_02510 [Candidatus Eremiobacteraceae bacterium]|nr:hypothetical protein [Candidatus Eremiobacteraceae bacterium]